MATTLLHPAPRQATRPAEPAPRDSAWWLVLAAMAALCLVLAPRLPGAVGVRATAVDVAFVALFVQSLPFLLAGAAIASFVRVGPGRRLLTAAVRRPRLARALAPLTGAVLPLCDCGIVPLARELRDRGAGAAVVNGFVAGSPLTNPIVILSTLVAFPGSPAMVAGRLVVGVAVAMIVASLAPAPKACDAGHEDAVTRLRPGAFGGIAQELGRTGPVLVLGALAAGLVKGLVPASAFASLGTQPLVGAAAMMALAFLMSICSQADAFVAASLPIGALPRLAFLVLGPMLDLRLTLFYRREFGARWVLGYAAVVVPSVLVLATAWTTWGPR